MSTKQVYHYVYRITNTIKNKHYYGVRSCKIPPKLDLGIRYFSSSKDREFIKDQKSNPNNYKYKIVAITDTRIDAVKLEVKLHNKFNVGMNSHFYNKAKQTSTGFDTTGVVPHNKGKPHSLEAKQKMSEAQKGRRHSEATKEKLSIAGKGRIHTEESKEKISAAKKGNTWNKGKSHSKETKEKIAAALKGRQVSEETRQKMSIALKGKVPSEETRKKLSAALKGINNPRSKLGNIYCRYTHELIAENVVITVWANANGYDYSTLLATARADRSKPSSKTNKHYHKGIYAKYV